MPVDVVFFAVIIPTFIPNSVVGIYYQIHFLILALNYVTVAYVFECSFSVFAGFFKEHLFSRNAKYLSYLSAILLGSLGLFLIVRSALVLS